MMRRIVIGVIALGVVLVLAGIGFDLAARDGSTPMASPSASADAPSANAGTELPPEASVASPGGPASLSDRAAPPLLDGTPESASASGELAEGFPVSAVPMPAGAQVVTSSVTAEGTTVQVALAGRSLGSADDVIGFYRSAYAELGLAESPAGATPADGSSSVVFTRPDASISVTTRTEPGGTTFSVFAAIAE